MDEELDKIVRRLVDRLRPSALILLGSRARGDWGPWSDYDLLIIADFKERYLDRFLKLFELFGSAPIEPHAYTLDEALSMLKKGNPLLVDAMEEGIVLHKGRGYEKLKKAYEELKEKGLRKSRTSVILPD